MRGKASVIAGFPRRAGGWRSVGPGDGCRRCGARKPAGVTVPFKGCGLKPYRFGIGTPALLGDPPARRGAAVASREGGVADGMVDGMCFPPTLTAPNPGAQPYRSHNPIGTGCGSGTGMGRCEARYAVRPIRILRPAFHARMSGWECATHGRSDMCGPVDADIAPFAVETV